MSQRERLRALLDDLAWHNTVEIQERVYGGHLGVARISGRLYEIKRALPAGWTIDRRPTKENAAIWEFRLVPPSAPPADLFGVALSLMVLVVPWSLLVM